ncbi:SDR family NAD(P)-dependent oxidoreductase [Bradyrhizobium cenepequi]
MPKPEELKEGVVVVTGGSRGIGASITRSALRRGFRVAALSRSGELPGGVEPYADRVTAMAADLNSEEKVRECFAALDARFGKIRALVNNAGIHRAGVSARTKTEEFESILQTNTVAAFRAMRDCYPYLKRQGGVVINIGSVFETLGAAQNASYSASKGALSALTRSLASEWARDGIILLTVAPGYVATDMNTDYLARSEVADYFARQTMIGRPAQADEVGELVAGLLDLDLALLTGQTLRADGGHSVGHGHLR